MNLRNVSLLLILTIIFSGCGNKQAADGPLQLTVKSDKTIYKVGDDIVIDFVVQNISNGEIKITHAVNPTFNFDVSFVDKDGTRCPRSYFPTEVPINTTITLKPKERFTHMITGTIKKERGDIGERNKREDVYGIFVRFSEIYDSFLNNLGEYDMQAYYKNALEGKLIKSNKITIKIVE